MSKLDKTTVNHIANSTKDFYSFPTYTIEGWKNSIKYLNSKGLSGQEIEAFLSSKHMRHAAELEYGANTEKQVKNYVEKYPKYISEEHLDVLMCEYFGD